ncbi:putative spermidine/putrescine transport system ATP-binding protein [Nocardioides albertanoniae]|uniref:Putative spermidine/putrescine transport system ATP-binding protein n=1 Tax=Nocardioides albertanoniae TaxID=1175486 RepID=A0A543A5K2_9ACTN|nr:ABC transporter ATP-binding protein [Nocardioides albertanoniae]TQL67881.1 putative spermidine/putrescine transport system ATP-binding protein [Nocardioides albertanoniae]
MALSTGDTAEVGLDSAPSISIRGLRKTYDEVVAVDHVDLDIADGEFFSMLGPSGSGKTTMLRLIAGFEMATAGTVHLGGTEVTRAAPFERDVHTVFQDYALFPHMNVLDNVAYGLRVRGMGKQQRRDRAQAALDRVRLGHLGTRRPRQLSGGQRQRVALARAIVLEPKVLLLDEPLGALDLKLREQMQVELKQLQRDLGITFVFVTHDQEEALTLSDRIAVFDAGRIQQLGTPREIYEHPASAYVAGFVGTTNLLDSATSERLLGVSSDHALRPERLRLSAATDAGSGSDDEVRLEATVTETIYLGAGNRVHLRTTDGVELIAFEQSTGAIQTTEHRGDHVTVRFARTDAVRLGHGGRAETGLPAAEQLQPSK